MSVKEILTDLNIIVVLPGMIIILVHVFNASPDKNFHPWLANELRERGFEVVTQTLPLVELIP